MLEKIEIKKIGMLVNYSRVKLREEDKKEVRPHHEDEETGGKQHSNH